MYNCTGPSCWIPCILICVAWTLAASGLLFLTWNKVICSVSRMKTVAFWQALLFVVTLVVFAGPRYFNKGRHCATQSCATKASCCHHKDMDEQKK